MRELALFAGAGGGILGGHLLGWRTVCAVEIDPFCREVLMRRQLDGHLPRFPIWDDVTTFDGRPWRGCVDVISGGFPCQDISCAGKGAGLDGQRSGLWSEFARIIGEVQPRYVLVENSPMLTSRGLGRVLGDLAMMGFDARWGVLGAVDAGAPHRRERIWIVAHLPYPMHSGWGKPVQPECELRGGTATDIGGDGQTQYVAYDDQQRRVRGKICREERPHRSLSFRLGWWSTEPDMGRVADGVANRVDRLAAIGNGQVPAVVRLAWEVLAGCVAAQGRE